MPLGSLVITLVNADEDRVRISKINFDVPHDPRNHRLENVRFDAGVLMVGVEHMLSPTTQLHHNNNLLLGHTPGEEKVARELVLAFLVLVGTRLESLDHQMSRFFEACHTSSIELGCI